MEIKSISHNEISKPAVSENKFDPDKRVDTERNRDTSGNSGYDVDRRVEIPENEVMGGSYSDVKKTSDGETHEVHHMPADTASHLDRLDGPTIKMEKEDHRQTASCGSSLEAREYQAKQKELIDSGNFREALQMDIDDIHEKFGSKYDEAISQMLTYVDKLEAEGKI
ncbi:MAG: hypothetical protein NC452_06185 [Eubacterium sp.]|nr:hypothetical protein [Eubacterium sp.]